MIGMIRLVFINEVIFTKYNYFCFSKDNSNSQWQEQFAQWNLNAK